MAIVCRPRLSQSTPQGIISNMLTRVVTIAWRVSLADMRVRDSGFDFIDSGVFSETDMTSGQGARVDSALKKVTASDVTDRDIIYLFYSQWALCVTLKRSQIYYDRSRSHIFIQDTRDFFFFF